MLLLCAFLKESAWNNRQKKHEVTGDFFSLAWVGKTSSTFSFKRLCPCTKSPYENTSNYFPPLPHNPISLHFLQDTATFLVVTSSGLRGLFILYHLSYPSRHTVHLVAFEKAQVVRLCCAALCT